MKSIKTLFQNKRLQEMFRFAVAGGVCFLIEYGLLFFFKEVLNIHYLIATGVAFIISVLFNYILCVKWVFKGVKGSGKKAQMLFFITSIVGFALNELFMWIFVGGLGLYYMFAKVITTVLVMVWNYISKRKVLVQ